MIRKGEDWGDGDDSPPDLVVDGGDAQLARAVAATPGALVWFRPDPRSDLARAVGLASGSAEPGTTVLALDALECGSNWAVNAIVAGTAPDRLRWTTAAHPVTVTIDGRVVHDGPATSVAIATGQFLRGNDLVPRGHPGDGRAEVQVYAVDRRTRHQLRRRLATGTHVPHPAIGQSSGRTITITGRGRAWPVEIDGEAREPVETLAVRVIPGAFRLLV